MGNLDQTQPRHARQAPHDLNRELVSRLQAGGEVFISNAIIDGAYALRACVVNFRTTLADIEALPGIVIRLGRAVDGEMRPGRREMLQNER